MATSIRKLKDDAAKLITKGKIDKALTLYVEVLDQEPGDVQARLKVAELNRRLEQIAPAVEAYELVARSYAEDGLLLKAIAICKTILQIDDSHVETQQLLADLYAKKAGPAVPALAAVSDDDFEITVTNEVIEEAKAAPPTVTERPSIPLFSDLDADAFVQLMERMSMREVVPGEFIIREGEVGTSFFVISSGEVKVTKLTSTGEEAQLAILGENAFFGEMELFDGSPRTASIVATQDTTLFEISREVINQIASVYPGIQQVLVKFMKQRMLSNLLTTSPIFAPLVPEQRRQLIELFKSREVPPGTGLMTQGQPGDGLYVLPSGEVEVTAEADGQVNRLALLKEGDVFGEIELLENAPAAASITTTRKSIVLRLSRHAFVQTSSTHPQLLAHLSVLSEERKRTTQAILDGKMKYGDDGLVLV